MPTCHVASFTASPLLLATLPRPRPPATTPRHPRHAVTTETLNNHYILRRGCNTTVAADETRPPPPMRMALSETAVTRLREQQQRRFSLHGRTAVVTGGHRGIGEAISIALLLAGAHVIVVDRHGPPDDNGATVCSSVPDVAQALGVRYAAVKRDLSDAAETEHAARDTARVAAQWGDVVSIIVNNAGVALVEDMCKLSVDDWERTMAINLRAPFLLTRHLICGSEGDEVEATCPTTWNAAVVNVSSAAARAGLHGHAAYSASKAGLEMMTRSMAVEWAPHGVRVNAVAPTVVLTDMGRRIWDGTPEGETLRQRVPAGRFAQPHEVADVVAFLCSDAAAMINGTVVAVDGGFSAM